MPIEREKTDIDKVEWVLCLPRFEGNLGQFKNHRTISLISHPSKEMLCIILNHLKSKAEELLSEEQVGFRAGWSTMEQIFNCRVLIEKHLQHQRDLFHNFIDFKKAFNQVWHNGLWHVLRGFNIEKGLIQVIQTLYDHVTSAVLLNNQLGEFFQMTIGVRQGCILSPTPFNLFLKRIMQETLHDHTITISIGGRPICNLHLQTISTSWWAVTVNCKNSPTNSLQQPVHMEWRYAQWNLK